MTADGAPAGIRPKWRPTLGLIVAGVLATVLALPLVGLFFFRVYENQLVRQTEGELIAQSAVLAALFAREVEALPADALALGAPAAGPRNEPFHPIEPALDLAGDDVRPRRPDALPAAEAPDPAWLGIGAAVGEVALRSQRATLAGFRLLDPRGVVVAGRGEVGLSLAHAEEVRDALRGRYRAVLRARVSDQPPPPVYSVSRGTAVRVFAATPVVVRDRVAGVVYASRTPSNIVKHLYGERRKLALAALAVLGTTLALGLVFARAVTQPIHALVARTRDVGTGPGAGFAPATRHGTREIALLAASFDGMAARLNERSDYIATFAAHVSHELKTPLTAIQGAAELMRDADAAGDPLTPQERRRFLDNIVADTGRLAAMLHRLRELARADNPRAEGTAALDAVLADLGRSYAAGSLSPRLAIVPEGSSGLRVRMAAENLEIVFRHLADNAARHGASALRVRASREGGTVRVEAADDGEGISPANRDRVFDAFFTTRRESGGTGMGLGIVRAMLRAHGGAIRLLDRPGGAAFELRIPAA